MAPIDLFKCLSDETRLKCVLLIKHCEELCVCQLTEALNLSQPKISRHLAELRKCGVLADTRRGKWVYYSLDPSLPDWAKNVIIETAEKNEDYYFVYLDSILDKQCLEKMPT